MTKHAIITEDLVNNIHAVLPAPPAQGLGYLDLRERVYYGQSTLRAGIKKLVAERRVEVVAGGLRNRKLFRQIAE